MVSRKKQGRTKQQPDDELSFVFEPVFLSEVNDNERIKRLARQILDCVERAKRERRRDRRERDTDLFAKDFDEIFGLKKSI
mgnify:CR=1 FL=1